MKLISSIIFLCTFNVAYASGISWNKLSSGQVYRLSTSITLKLDNREYEISQGKKIKLFSISDLDMIKVKLFKFKLSSCPSRTLTTDLDLVLIGQANGEAKSVGVNLSKGCQLDVYVEIEDLNSNSFANF